MADKKGGGKPPAQDELINNLVSDPSQTPDTKVLVGFLGKSNRAGYLRLYLTPELNSHVEIAQDDLLHSQSLATAENPLGGTMVWVRSDADLIYTRSEKRQAQADFLQGDITSGFMPKADMAGLSGDVQMLASTIPCTIVISVLRCPTVYCPTWFFQCSTRICPSRLIC